MADERTYIKVHDGLYDHPKIEPLTDAAFRTLVGLWCWCSRHLTDGQVPAAIWAKRGSPKVRRELLAAGLVETTTDGVVMHDYLEHQRSAAQVEEIKEARATAGAKGNHIRWHVRKGVHDPACPYCDGPPAAPGRSQNGAAPDPPGHPEPDRAGIAEGSQVRSQTSRKSSPETETETEITTTTAAALRFVARDDEQQPPPNQDHDPPHRPLQDALTTAGLVVRWDKLTDDHTRKILDLIAAHGIPALVTEAKRGYRTDSPPGFAQAFIGAWQALPPPGRLRAVAPACPEHDLPQPCRYCRADQLAADA
jgi:hypothetical protein